MREAVFILAVVFILLALTAIRYRRQIVAIITFWKQFQAARERLRTGAPEQQRQVDEPQRGIKLVNCARCGRWVPEAEAVRHSPTTFVCVRNCSLQGSKT
jgi:hypothetical protein